MDVVLFSSLWEQECHGGARGNAAGEGNPVIVEGEYLARQGMDWGFSFACFLKGFCFYC